MLLLLSHFSRVRLCATPWTAAHQPPPSLGFSRQEHWSGLPFPSPMHKSESEVSQSCPTLSDPMDCSLPGGSIHGICQTRVLEWGATRLTLVKAKSRTLSRLQGRPSVAILTFLPPLHSGTSETTYVFPYLKCSCFKILCEQNHTER